MFSLLFSFCSYLGQIKKHQDTWVWGLIPPLSELGKLLELSMTSSTISPRRQFIPPGAAFCAQDSGELSILGVVLSEWLDFIASVSFCKMGIMTVLTPQCWLNEIKWVTELGLWLAHSSQPVGVPDYTRWSWFLEPGEVALERASQEMSTWGVLEGCKENCGAPLLQRALSAAETVH